MKNKSIVIVNKHIRAEVKEYNKSYFIRIYCAHKSIRTISICDCLTKEEAGEIARRINNN